MVDYAFYKAEYMGSTISEKQFPELAARAEAVLERIRRCCRVTPTGETSEKLAVCAMADVLCSRIHSPGIRSASIGGVSLQYTDEKHLERQLIQAARTYLDIYRGVG